VSIYLFLGFAVSVSRADPMDCLICTYSFDTQELEKGLGEELCRSVANRLAARLIEPVELDAVLASKADDATSQMLHRLDVRFQSPYSIAMVYEFGSLDAWRTNEQTRLDDLAFDVMDKKIKREMFGDLAYTIARLSSRGSE